MSSWRAGWSQHEAEEQWSFSYWYQGVFRTQWRVKPASVRILMEAASASLTVSFTDCIKFWALWTNISVAYWRRNTVMKTTVIIHFNGYLGEIIDNLVIWHALKKRLCSPALTPLHWCWYDPTWWPWLWTGFWAECWWWEYAHTPETRSESEVKTFGTKTIKYSLSIVKSHRWRRLNWPGAGWSGCACQYTAWPPPWPAVWLHQKP